jgi:hypothetical protein
MTTYLQSKKYITNAWIRSRIRTNTLGRRRRTILLFLQRTRELVYVPRPCVGIYVQEISGGCFGSPLLTPAADTHEELD